MKGLSIDVGVHNLSFYIEEFEFTSEIKNACFSSNRGTSLEGTSQSRGKKLNKNKRFQKNGEATKEYYVILEKIFSHGKTIYFENNDFAQGINANKIKVNDPSFIDIFKRINKYMSELSELKECKVVVIERQMKTNPLAQRIEQHIISWFTINIPDIDIVIFNAANKTRLLGAPKTTKGKGKKPLRKKWAIDMCKKILTLRKDESTLKKLLSAKKKDDLSDVVCQFAAFKVNLFLDQKTF